MKMEKIKVIIVKPNEKPYVQEIEDTLPALQNIVGGYIEYVDLEENVSLICNEEGKIKNLPFNRKVCDDIIVGTFIITGVKDEEEISLTDEQIEKYLQEFALEKENKPKCKLIGEDGNIYNLMGIASRTLKQNNMRDEAKEMCDRITSSKSYDDALIIISEYVEITGDEEEENDFEYEDEDEID
jgi:hypothetical protein